MTIKNFTTYHGPSTYNVVNRTTGAIFNTYGEPAPGIVVYGNTRNSVSTPDYYAKVAAGEDLPVNPYSARQIILSKPSGGTLKNVRCGYDIVGTMWRPSWALGTNSNDPRTGKTWAAQTQSEAQSKTLIMVGDLKANLIVSMAEAKQTVSMVAELARRVNDAFVHLRRGRHQLVYDLLHYKPVNSARNDWLAYRYGWIPLMSDAHGLAEAAAAMTDGYFRVGWPFKSSSSRIEEGKILNLPVKPIYSYNLNFHPSIQSSGGRWINNIKAYAGFWARPQRHALHNAQIVGLTNPALIVWELVPYSFVFDWFVNVGDYLQTRSALDGIEIYRGWSGVKDDLLITGSVRADPNAASNCKAYTGPSYGVTIRDESYSRVPWSGSLPPSLHLIQRDPLNTKRIADAVALGLGLSRR